MDELPLPVSTGRGGVGVRGRIGFGDRCRNAKGEGDRVRRNNRARAVTLVPRCGAQAPIPEAASERDEWIEQLLDAIADIDRDDIHQAAARLAKVQDWIIRETERAAADPIFDALRLAS